MKAAMMKAALLLSTLTAVTASPTLIDENAMPVISQEIVDKINSNPASTWKAEESSRFSGMSVGDLRMMMGARFVYENLPTIKHSQDLLDAAPASFDPRTSRPECTGKVLDQGFCGSCWAFGAVEAISDRLCISKQKQNGGNASYVYLSPLDMTACNGGFFSGENGCQGGQLGGAWNYAKKTGLVTESCFPYLKSENGPVPTCDPTAQPCLPESKFIKTPSCTKKCANGNDWSADKHKLTNVYNIDASQLMAELATNGPVESAFTVYADFVHYKSGVYKHVTGSMLGGHAIKVIGYGTENGNDYWLVQNSWTTTWGDGGYFKIARGNDECGIEDQMIGGTF
jgi:cathepsin B